MTSMRDDTVVLVSAMETLRRELAAEAASAMTRVTDDRR
jgi:hypothetical protein